jgi:hypothetical protein
MDRSAAALVACVNAARSEHVGGGGPTPTLSRDITVARAVDLADPLVQLMTVGRCKLKPVETRVESAWFQLLKLEYHKLLSMVTINFNLRRYMTGEGALAREEIVASTMETLAGFHLDVQLALLAAGAVPAITTRLDAHNAGGGPGSEAVRATLLRWGGAS